MKKKYLVLVVSVLALLMLMFTSCTIEEVSSVSIFDMYDSIQEMLDIDKKESLNAKSEYTNSAKYEDASDNFLLIRESVTVEEAEMTKLTVTSIKTNEDIYSITYKNGTNEPSKISSVEIVLGKEDYSLNDIGKDYFIVTTRENAKDDTCQDIITVEIHNIRNERLCSFKGSVSSFEKSNYVSKLGIERAIFEQKTPCVFSINEHIFFMNKLYRHEESGLVLVKELDSERLLSLDYEKFDYMNEKYVYMSDDGEFYVFDKELNFVRYEKVDVPFGYTYKFVGVLNLDKVVYVLDKRVDKDDVLEGEVYDFIFDGIAYTRDFYTYSLTTGATSKIDDILYLDTISILCKDYINSDLEEEEKINLGADVILTTDLEMIDDKYYKRDFITYTTDSTFYELRRVENEINGLNVSILGKLSTGNYVVSLPIEIAVFNRNKEKIGSISGEVLRITDKYIITSKGVLDHELNAKYMFAENEEPYGAVGNTLIILSTTKGSVYNTVKSYYSFGDNGKKEIISVDGYSFGGVTCYDTFYRVEKRVDEKYITTFYFENGEVIAEIESFSPYIEYSIYFTRLENALIIAYEKDSEYQYVYAYVK